MDSGCSPEAFHGKNAPKLQKTGRKNVEVNICQWYWNQQSQIQFAFALLVCPFDTAGLYQFWHGITV